MRRLRILAATAIAMGALAAPTVSTVSLVASGGVHDRTADAAFGGTKIHPFDGTPIPACGRVQMDRSLCGP